MNTSYHEAGLRTDDVGGLGDVGSVQQVVVRVGELAVAELEFRQKILQHLVVYLPPPPPQHNQPISCVAPARHHDNGSKVHVAQCS